MNSCGGSGGNLIQQYQNQYRRRSFHSPSPPLVGVPLAPQKRWDTNPSIFIEEYHDDEQSKSKTESEKNSRETLCSSSESLQPLNECNIKSLGDLTQIPFIDDEAESAPCNFDGGKKPVGSSRKTVSFDVIAGETSGHRHLFTNNGKNFPKPPNSNPFPTDKTQLFHAPRLRANVRSTRDGINRYHDPPSSCNDHCTLIDKLIRIKLEEGVSPRHCTRDSKFGEGKVKALTTYFNSLPYMNDCRCSNVHQSTPDLSISHNRNKLTHEEMESVRRQLKEWSEFGLPKNHSPCRERACLRSEKFCECKQFEDVELAKRRRLHRSLNGLENLFNPPMGCCFNHKSHHCHSECRDVGLGFIEVQSPPVTSEKHKCRSACYRDPAKKKKKIRSLSVPDDDNESFVI